jgi:hypothetical protein
MMKTRQDNWILVELKEHSVGETESSWTVTTDHPFKSLNLPKIINLATQTSINTIKHLETINTFRVNIGWLGQLF